MGKSGDGRTGDATAGDETESLRLSAVELPAADSALPAVWSDLSPTSVIESATPSPDDPSLAIDGDFDGYVLIRCIGRGAMGVVFRAHDVVLDRSVAIKVVAAVKISPEARERFLREVRAIARLQHPNVVAVHRAGYAGGRPYLVSELVQGRSLDQLKLPLPQDEILSLALGLAAGLAAAHRKGVLHRDLKPANVLRSDEGEIKLCDFGLAKLLDEVSPARRDTPPSVESSAGEEDVSRSGVVNGTPMYLAPERWLRSPATVQSDLYSLGAILYQVATGHPPHRTRDLKTLAVAVLSGPPRPLADVANQVDPRLAELVDRCLQREPAMRPVSADEVHAELMAIAVGAHAVVAGNPYRGLHAFYPEHAALFFGRQRETAAVCELIRGRRLVVVAGDSGVGKSSLCHAGVAPLVAGGALRDRRVWSTVRLSPGRWPLVELARALTAFIGDSGDDAETRLASALREDPDSVARRLCGVLRGRRALLLFVDQLEELATESAPQERDAAAAALATLAAGIPGVRVLATARSDFLSRLAALPGLDRELSGAIYLLGPMGETERREIVVGPARVAGVRFESDSLIDDLVSAAGETASALPLLEFALAELWECRDRARGIIPAASLDAIGGVAGALARHADGVLAAMTAAERRCARRVLTRLVTTDGTRKSCSEAELVGDDPATAGALRALVRGRLLAVHGDEEGRSAYELTHEVLLAGWTTLRGWLDRDAAQRSVRERLAVAAAEWQRLGRAHAALWGAPQLDEAERVELSPTALAGREQAFLTAALAARRWQVRRRRALALAAPLVVLALWGGLAFEERLSRSRGVAAQLSLARPELAAAAASAADAGRLRRRAFAAFDAGAEDGESLWGRAGRAREQADRQYAVAAQALEAALQVDRERDDVRDLLASSFYSRALLAESFHDRRGLAENLERLRWQDVARGWRRRWNEPASLALRTVPAEAHVQLQSYAKRGERRVLGEASELGTTPLQVALAPGSYLLTLSIAGRSPVRYPLLLARSERLGVELSVPERVPEGYVYVPAGRFLYDSAQPEDVRAQMGAGPQRPVQTSGYLIGRFEVTWAEWIEFVNAAPAGRRQGRLVTADGVRLENPEGDRFRLWLRPSTIAYHVELGAPLVYRDRHRRRTQDWRRFPVTGIAIEDATAFTGWLDATGRLPGARLCTDREWERAARGADDRVYPGGDAIGADDANVDVTYGRLPGGFGPDEVGSHGASDSPFGVADMTGNAWEYVSSAVHPARHFIRGGGYYEEARSGLLTNRGHTEPGMRDRVVGMRVCAPAAVDVAR